MILRILRNVRPVPLLVGVLLCVISVWTYINDPAVPGNKGRFPLGWWGWWDQSQYLLSARSLAHGDLLTTHHWYPLGYAVLAAPFTVLFGLHAFLIPDLLCLLLCFASFLLFARCVGLASPWAALAFLLATCGKQPMRDMWAEPWNTTMSSALVWWLLALTALQFTQPARSPRHRMMRFALIGAIAVAIPFVRPTDALLVAVWAAGVVPASLYLRAVAPRDLAPLLIGAGGILLPEAALWLSVYGIHESQYMKDSQGLGFAFDSVGWKTYLLLLTPRPWFPFGDGIVQRLPWVVPGLCGITALFFITNGPARILLMLLTAMMVAYSLLFFSYVDLIPSGLWLFHNIHYFKWVMPGLVLLGVLLLRALLFGPRRAAMLAALPALLLVGLRMPPRPATALGAAWMIQVPGPVPGFDESYFGSITLRDAHGPLKPVRDFRALPDDQGWRLIALRRPFSGTVVIGGLGHWPDGVVPSTAPRWTRGIGLWPLCLFHTCHKQ